MKEIGQLENHVILCGYGRNGSQAAETLRHHKVPFVIIENSDKRIEHELENLKSCLFVKGDATEDEVLVRAGIKTAKALITALHPRMQIMFLSYYLPGR